MCAINGCTGNNAALMDRMVAVTKHRGPDGSRVYTNEYVSFGFNRLAIIDLDQRSMQPMQSVDERYTIMFNGEIYNYRELKKELASYPYRTESDTEVILAAYTAWGTAGFQKLNGMFALALWDSLEKKLILARDPVGVKPLYYAVHQGALVFSSEVKGVLESGIPRKLNTDAFFHFMRLMYVPGSMTMIEGIHKLPPGHLLTFQDGTMTTSSFEALDKPASCPPTYTEAVHRVRTVAENAIQRQLVSDRPIGIYLSGGIDSTIVLAAASKVHPKLNTYSVGFELTESEEREKFNADSVLAAQSAAHFGATHHEYMLRPGDVHALFPRMIQAMDQPVGNATTLAQLYLAERTKDTATVVLSGEGGDELFGGYERYQLALIAERYARFLPRGLERFLPGSLKHLRLKGVDRYAQLMFQKDAEIFPILAPGTPPDTRSFFASDFSNGDVADLLMRADEKHWLVDEALLRADTMSMGASIEARVPLLDLELRSLAHSFPRQWKVDTSRTKKILKDAFADVIPHTVLHQPKRGWFSPGAKWLRRPEFVELAHDVFQDGYTDASHLFSNRALREMWESHTEKRAYHYTTLWASLVFLAWAKEYNVTV